MAEELHSLDSPPDAWVELIGVSPADQLLNLSLSDHFSPGINDLLQGLDYAYPGTSDGRRRDRLALARMPGRIMAYFVITDSLPLRDSC